MAVPLRSANLGRATSMQFAHVGVLDAGHQSKASMAVSLTINVLLALVVTIISLAATQTIEANRKLTVLVEPVIPKKPDVVKPKVTPPPKPKLPEIKVEQPKIAIIPKIKPPELPKQPIVKMDNPKPLLAQIGRASSR